MSSDKSHYFSECPPDPSLYTAHQATLAGRTDTVLTAPGVFSATHLDHGTAVLFRKAPTPPASGTFLDIGCGWGPIALTLGLLAPEANVKAIDVNLRALDLTTRNAQAWGVSNVSASTPESLPEDMTFDVIWSNPPIRVGRAVTQEILMTWLPRLAPSGCAYLVIQRNLGADPITNWLKDELPEDWSVDKIGSAKGFRVIEVRRPSQEST